MNFELIAGIIILSSTFGYLLIINFIYFLSPNKKWNEFPEKCSHSTKCSRVADVNTRGYGLKPISTKEDPILTQENIENMLTEKTKMRILNSKEGFIHAVDITPFFRFHDDIAIKIFTTEDITTIWLHSQSRLGIFDLNVNERRVQSLHKMISALG
tara:strand:- start:3404 stop:3871 length:468 start_codon:yes stop_codon:yes gene_type:complete